MSLTGHYSHLFLPDIFSSVLITPFLPGDCLPPLPRINFQTSPSKGDPFALLPRPRRLINPAPREKSAKNRSNENIGSSPPPHFHPGAAFSARSVAVILNPHLEGLDHPTAIKIICPFTAPPSTLPFLHSSSYQGEWDFFPKFLFSFFSEAIFTS